MIQENLSHLKEFKRGLSLCCRARITENGFCDECKDNAEPYAQPGRMPSTGEVVALIACCIGILALCVAAGGIR